MILRYLPAVVLILGLSAGCNSANKTEPPAGEAHDDHAHDHGHDHGDDHDHAHGDHDHAHGDGAHAKTFAEAVEKIETARNTIRDGLTGGEKEKADAALHDLGHLLEHVPELTTEMAEEEQAAIKKDLDELFGFYGKLDEQIHGGVEVTYDTWSKQIDEVVERLRSRVK